MHPKTFHIVVRRGICNGLHLHLHAEDWRTALARLTALLPGVNVEPTVLRWEGKRTDLRPIGNNDPVILMDCDVFRKRRRVNGRMVALPMEPGEFRKSEDDVASDLLKAFRQLEEDRQGIFRSFAAMERHYPEMPTAYKYQQMVDMKETAERYLTWQNNLWAEYSRLQASRAPALVLPEPVHLLERSKVSPNMDDRWLQTT